MTAQKKGYAP